MLYTWIAPFSKCIRIIDIVDIISLSNFGINTGPFWLIIDNVLDKKKKYHVADSVLPVPDNSCTRGAYLVLFSKQSTD